MAEADDAVGHEQVDRDEDETRDGERDVDGEVDHAPVRRQRRERPGTENVKEDGTDDQQDQDDSEWHMACTPLQVPNSSGVALTRRYVSP